MAGPARAGPRTRGGAAAAVAPRRPPPPELRVGDLELPVGSGGAGAPALAARGRGRGRRGGRGGRAPATRSSSRISDGPVAGPSLGEGAAASGAAAGRGGGGVLGPAQEVERAPGLAAAGGRGGRGGRGRDGGSGGGRGRGRWVEVAPELARLLSPLGAFPERAGMPTHAPPPAQPPGSPAGRQQVRGPVCVARRALLLCWRSLPQVSTAGH